MLEIFISVAVVIFYFMTGWFLLAAITKRNDIADIAWGLGFIVVVYYLYALSQNNSPHFSLILFLTTLWGVRLATHIYRRFIKRSEDSRYVEMKKDWGKWYYIRTYLQVFILQGLLMLLISSSAIVAALNYTESLHWINTVGAVIWVVGFYFETLGDLQLSQFIADPKNKGKIMTSGLWRFTRHPNYFGEVSQWWGIFLIAVTLPLGYLAIISPLTITYLILKVSGIPMLEKKYLGRKDFQEYKKRTSAFFPMLPKES
jgi:steroid 5-alpha reductase family enzyme